MDISTAILIILIISLLIVLIMILNQLTRKKELRALIAKEESNIQHLNGRILMTGDVVLQNQYRDLIWQHSLKLQRYRLELNQYG